MCTPCIVPKHGVMDLDGPLRRKKNKKNRKNFQRPEKLQRCEEATRS